MMKLTLVEVLVLVLRLEVHRLALVSTGEGDIGMGRASNNAEAWLTLCFTLWVIRDVQPQVQDPHGGIVIRHRRSVRLILAMEPMAVEGISQWVNVYT
ncbi:hypothetical protein EDB82DRAFT_506452 [Fusarium venenatum]|uniref:uncharacterized protein n=1 Tax=Fusarium venenatum TaxID=56646 RepID=UPI001DF1BBF2|nr:hypothetical protein EDB82DRAFT_506452 [Fusarium venenatum]